MILVDTSAWIEFFHATGSKFDEAIQQLVSDGDDISVCALGLAEMLQGLSDDTECEKAKRSLMLFPIYLPSSADSYVRAADTHRECKRRGFKTTLNDCLIATTAIENNLALLHNRQDFDVIAEVTGKLRLYRI